MPIDPIGIDPDLSPNDPSARLVVGIIAALLASSSVNAIAGTAVYDSKTPQDVDRPAVIVQRISDRKGHVLKGSDATSLARISFKFLSSLKSDCSSLQLAVFNLFDSFQGMLPGGVVVMAAIQENDVDMNDASVGSDDESIFQIVSDYMFRYRCLTAQR